jgi:hypothetical protein
MKRYLVAIFILTLAASAYPKEIREMFRERAAVTVTPAAKNYIMASYSSAQGWDLRRMADDSVIKAGGMDTTAADGTRYVKPYNSVAFSGTPEAGMLQTTPTGLQIYLDGEWGAVTAAPAPPAIPDLTDWPSAISVAELEKLDGATGQPLQAQINALSAGKSGYVSPPTYSNDSCTQGQWSVDSGLFYVCKPKVGGGTQWDNIALAGWNNPGSSVAYLFYWPADSNTVTYPGGSMTQTGTGTFVAGYQDNAASTSNATVTNWSRTINAGDIFGLAQGKITAYVRIPAAGMTGDRRIFQVSGQTGNFLGYVDSSGRITFSYGDGYTMFSAAAGQFNLNADTWYPVEFSWNGTSIYIKSGASTKTGTVTTAPTGTASTLYINGGSGTSWADVDEFYVYPEAGTP